MNPGFRLSVAALMIGLVGCAPAAPPAPTAAPAPPTAAPAAAPKPTTAPAPPAATQAPTAAPAAQAALTTVRYGLPTAPPTLDTVGVYFAIDNNFFKDEGLDVQVTPFAGGTTAIRALLSRELDIIETDPSSALLANLSGAPTKVISSP